MALLKEALEKKWGPLLDVKGLPSIANAYKRACTAILLENQETEAIKASQYLAEDAPANQSGAFPTATNLKGFDPVLIALVRRAMPNLIAYDVCGVQPMSGPTGLIFALRSKYSTQGGTEALFNEANTSFSSANLSANSHVGTSPANTTYDAAGGVTTLQGEGLGTASNTAIPEMAFSIDSFMTVELCMQSTSPMYFAL